jgi:hypothetical protein
MVLVNTTVVFIDPYIDEHPLYLFNDLNFLTLLTNMCYSIDLSQDIKVAQKKMTKFIFTFLFGN